MPCSFTILVAVVMYAIRHCRPADRRRTAYFRMLAAWTTAESTATMLAGAKAEDEEPLTSQESAF